MGVVRRGNGYGVRQVFDPVERMWTFQSPEIVTEPMKSAMVKNVLGVQNGRRVDCLRKFGPGPRNNAFLDSIRALEEGRYRVVVSNRDNEVFAFKQTVGTGKAFSLPTGG